MLLVDNSEYDQKGKITAVNGLMNATTGTTEFRAEFTNPQGILRSGSSGVIRLPIVSKDVIIVPQNAVFEVQGKQIVYVVEKDNKVKSRIIETSGASGMNFIVTSGLSNGEVIVIEGTSKLRDDMEIVPQPKNSTPEKVETVAKDSVQTKTTTVNK